MNDIKKPDNSSGAARGSASRPGDRSLQDVRDDVTKLREDASQTFKDWEGRIRDRLTEQPYATLAVAAGFGYVLGGGLPPFLIRTLLLAGGRLAVENLIAQRVVQS